MHHFKVEEAGNRKSSPLNTSSSVMAVAFPSNKIVDKYELPSLSNKARFYVSVIVSLSSYPAFLVICDES